jgi:SAM-dependent methyltransferase
VSGAHLPADVQARFDAWVEAEQAEALSTLRFAEVRRGAQALSALYVQGRTKGHLARRAADGAGKRAAFACYYAPLHFLVAWAAADAVGLGGVIAVRDVHDLGCGTGVVGAAVALQLGGARVKGVDVAPWTVAASRRTYRALGVRGRARAAALPGAFPRAKGRDVVVAGWSLNELDESTRGVVLQRIADALRGGAGLMVLEPLSTRVTPWWPEAVAALGPLGATEELVRVQVDLPEWLARMDKAAGLDHRQIGARVLSRLPA